MRSVDRGIRADAMAARAWPDPADVGQRRNLAVRGRRQRPMAAGARQRRFADHAAGTVIAIPGLRQAARPGKTGLIFFETRVDSPRPGSSYFNSETVLRAWGPRLASEEFSRCASCISSPPNAPQRRRRL